MKKVIYGCIKGLDGRIPDCKLGMHAKCFNEIKKSMILDPCCRQNGVNNRFERLKSCCHHSLRDLCVYTDCAWWKLKKYCHQKDIGSYPDGCIICLKSFSMECVSAVNKSSQIVKMKVNERKKNQMHGLFNTVFFILNVG